MAAELHKLRGEIVAASKRQKIGEVHEKNGCSRGQGSRPSAGVFDDGHESEEDGGPITFRRSSVLSKTKADMQKGGTSKDTSSIGEENSVSKLAKSEMRLHAKNLASTLGAAVSCPNTGTLLDPVIDSHSKQPKSTSTLPSNPLPQKKSSISSAVFSNNGGGKSTSVSVNPNSSGPKTMRTPSGFSGHSENNTASVSESKSVPDHLMHISSNELQDSLQEKAPRVLSGTTIRQSLKRSSMEQALNNTHSSEVSIVAMTKDSDEVKSVLPHVKSSSNYENDDIDSDEDKPLSSRLAASSLVPTKEIATLRKSTAFMLESSAKMISLEEENSGSEDDKPLSERLLSYKAATARPSLIDSIGRNGHFKDVCDKLGKPSKLACAKDASDDESDDDKPLSQRLNPKVSMKAVGLGTVHSGKDLNDEKPLSEKIVENASMKLQKKEMISKFSNKKRPHDQNSVPASAAKKLKVSPETAKLQVKHRLEVPSDDEDEVPLSKRIPQSFSTNKPVITKKVSSGVTIATKKVLEARRAKTGQMKKALTTKSRISMPKGAPGSGGGQKWTTLEHNGVIFPPPYQVHGIKMLYDGKPVDLTPEQEEVATMFAVMKDTDYASKPKFISNFWSDWKQILGLNHIIKKLEHCDFTPIYEWHLREKEKKKSMSALEKKRIKEEKLNLEEKYMWALVDGVKEKVGNFRVEPPGLFRGRGEHPKMGKLKKRIFPENIVINVGKDAPIPDCPMPGHRWKEVRRDNTVTWLAYWNDPINSKEFKYVFLAPSSSLKGQSDKEKYEKSRKLKDYIEDIRKTYTKGFSSSDSIRRQIAVATYLIDRLALRAGNEKDDDEADTVGCCSLKVEHVSLIPPHSLEFDFLGKDSIRYFNTVEVEERVYKAIGDFKKSKKDGDDLFDKLDTSKLNAHLKEIMPGLTAKVFRTYNASITLDTQLQSANGDTVTEKIAAYQGANKEVAILCNHQRSVSKSHSAQMERLESKMAELEALRVELKRDLDRARKGKPPLKDADGKSKRNQTPEALQKKIDQTDQKIEKMKLDMRIKDDLKTVALGTSKINYMDPRITVAWCKRHEVPIEKIFNKSLLAKFSWAMDVEPDFRF
ncbi:hypothetical protein O6H91_15G061100 [Diphasiastrum complanatum]|uniref:Uncharacterized protein n=1 Tax=Diphasiastrum complanatum TaxID=34168 RepID=A0ACC2BIV3_DIPCM|nr:hypothetical protein O6H91_15G061100 [Diphasiastrum complanatum]